MNIAYKILFCSFLLSQVCFAQDNFPDEYLGIYKGTLNIESQQGKQKFPMEFHLLKTDTLDRYRYVLVYGEGEKKQVRNYHMIAKNKEKGEYVVDENNGIILTDKRFGNTLYSLFEVNENLLTTFITFEEDQVIWEITFAPKKEKEVSYATSDSTKVIAYPIKTRQKAFLKKQ